MADCSVYLFDARRAPIGVRSGRAATIAAPPPVPAPPVAALPAAAARSGPVRRPVPRPERAMLSPAGLPLLRRTRLDRTRLNRMLGGSAVGHALLLVGLALLFARQARLPPPQEPPAVDMVYGTSGMMGRPDSPDQGGGAKPQQPVAPPTAAPAQPQVNVEMPPAPPPLEMPDLSPLPIPPPPPPAPPKLQQRAMRVPLGPPSQHAARSSNPFSHPMDLSFAQPGPPRQRSGRAGGSGSAIDLSLGPLVKNGHLMTPYASPSVKGVSDDYGAELDSWIRRHLYYPPDAAQRGEDGPSHVHVEIDRTGHVKSVRLVDSSGSWTLDSATEGMFRGRTLPPVPPDMQGDHFDIDLTVDYILQR